MPDTQKNIGYVHTLKSFACGRACSDTLFHVLSRAYGHEMPKEERAAATLAGGIMQRGYQCGMIWGSTLAAGAEAYRRFGTGAQAEAAAVHTAAKIVEAFEARKTAINCSDITHIDHNSSKWEMLLFFLLKGGVARCFHLAGRYAPESATAIESGLENPPKIPNQPPVSCVAALLKKIGASDLHATMAAGLAGGIGLCGGGCGALGAAIWYAAMSEDSKNDGNLNLWDDKEFKARADAIFERFQEASNYAFECEEIVGKRFKGLEEHAQHLESGGCTTILDALAAELSEDKD